MIVGKPENICFHAKRATKANESEDNFQCPNEGCIKIFNTSEELSNHLLVDNCCIEYDLSSSSIGDVTKRKYIQKMSDSEHINVKLSLAEDTEVRSAVSDLSLKEAKRIKRFNDN
jgi:hypothetical protein